MARMAIMRSISVSQTKDRLSALLGQVRAGESVLITDRGVPVARLEPVASTPDGPGRVERLTRAGLVRPGSGTLPAWLLDEPTERPPRGSSAVADLLAEREQGW